MPIGSIEPSLNSMQAQVMDARRAGDPESSPDDLVLQCTQLLSTMTDKELSNLTSERYTNLSPDEQLLLFFRCAQTT